MEIVHPDVRRQRRCIPESLGSRCLREFGHGKLSVSGEFPSTATRTSDKGDFFFVDKKKKKTFLSIDFFVEIPTYTYKNIIIEAYTLSDIVHDEFSYVLSTGTLQAHEEPHGRQLKAVGFGFQRFERVLQLHRYVYMFRHFFVRCAYARPTGMGLSSKYLT